MQIMFALWMLCHELPEPLETCRPASQNTTLHAATVSATGPCAANADASESGHPHLQHDNPVCPAQTARCGFARIADVRQVRPQRSVRDPNAATPRLRKLRTHSIRPGFGVWAGEQTRANVQDRRPPTFREVGRQGPPGRSGPCAECTADSRGAVPHPPLTCASTAADKPVRARDTHTPAKRGT